MIHSVIAEKYAKALFGRAKSTDEIQREEQELKSFLDALHQIPNGSAFFSSPHIRREEKEKVIHRFALSKTTLSFLSLLIRKSRFSLLEDIFREYTALVKQKFGIVDVELTTTVPAQAELKDELKAKLSNTGKTIDLAVKVDPSLLGGGILNFNNRVLDFSLRGKLQRMKKNLLSR